MLRSPAVAIPIRWPDNWIFSAALGGLLGSYVYRLLGGLDLIKEEEKPVFAGPGPARVYEFAELGVRAGALQPGPGLDAAAGADRQERLRLAGPALAENTSARSPAWTRSPTKNWICWPAGVSPACG